jgi:putative flavoprotein involved in K+ transport
MPRCARAPWTRAEAEAIAVRAVDHEVIVVGAGASGLAAAAMLRKRGIESLVVEKSDRVGVSWCTRYDDLRLNTLGWMSRLPELRPGWGPRGFPSRDRFVEYLERYAARHRLEIQFETDVVRLDREEAAWRLDTSRGSMRSEFAVIATGYDLVPKLPDVPGIESYSGELVHSAEYRNASRYAGRDVLVVSAGVTGSELAYFLAEGGAARVRVAVRTPPNILRRCRFGIPLNPAGVVLDRLPSAVGDRVTALSQRMIFGDLSGYGLPRPPKGVVSSLRERRVGPAIDDGFVEAVKQGRIEIVAALEAFDNRDVILAGGERIRLDAVIAATGYERGLEPLVGHLGLIGEFGEPKVKNGATHPSAPGLYFVGYVTTLGGHLRGIRLESKKMARALARQRAGMHTA